MSDEMAIQKLKDDLAAQRKLNENLLKSCQAYREKIERQEAAIRKLSACLNAIREELEDVETV